MILFGFLHCEPGGEHSVQRSCPSLCIIKGGVVVAAS